MQVTAVLTPAKEGGFVAYNPETGTTSQGDTIEEAIANLREAVPECPSCRFFRVATSWRRWNGSTSSRCASAAVM